MADLPKDPPIKLGEEPMTKECASPEPGHVDTTSIKDELISGQQDDAHRKKETAVGSDGDTSSPKPEHIELSGNGNDTNNIDTFNAADSASDNDPSDDKAPDDKAATQEIQLQTEPQAKKKKRKGKKKKGDKNVTGFEEFYADVPMKPAEAAHEKNEVYNPSRGFGDRIEECIQRYRASRRLDNDRTKLFNKYLWLGGVDASPRAFTGFADDPGALEEADAEQIRQMTATDFIGGSGKKFYDPTQPEHWVVDFEGIVKGFLSRVVPGIYMYDEPVIHKAADLVKNFLNYVLMHDVCPEYDDNVMAARNICDIAPIELRIIHELYNDLPGEFNLTVSSLFHDREIEKTEYFDKLVMLRLTIIFSTLLSDEIKKKFAEEDDPTQIYVASTKEEVYEVFEVARPNPQHILAIEKELEKKDLGGKAKSVGILKLKPSVVEFGYNNVPRLDQIDMSNAEVEEYLIEEEILDKLEIGMKITAVMGELNIGLHFIKEIKDIRASFDTFLPQMLMEGWKEPVPNERPAPSIHDNKADEGDIDGAGVDDD